METNQDPITNPTVLTGESLVTTESPTGERLNSPVVWNKYIPKTKTMGINPPSFTSGRIDLAPTTMIKYPNAI